MAESQNTKPSEMTYESRIMQNIQAERTVAATQADDMTVAELKQAAEDLQIDTGGASSKAALKDAVKSAARPTTTKEG
jgi:hypothetical protein